MQVKESTSSCHQAASEAKHQIQMHARYQEKLRAQAKRAIEEYHGSAAGQRDRNWNNTEALVVHGVSSRRCAIQTLEHEATASLFVTS